VTLARFFFIKTINNPDVLYAITDLSILACSEVGVCIIATSAGTLRPLFVRKRPGDATRRLDLPVAQIDEGTETTTPDVESMHGPNRPTEKLEGNFDRIAVQSFTVL
jgi:hypothetical protein